MIAINNQPSFCFFLLQAETSASVTNLKEKGKTHNLNLNTLPLCNQSGSKANSNFGRVATLSSQSESINVYESYIDDSYVGEFTGGFDPSLIEEGRNDDTFWQNDDKLLEFSFDSFGPESMLFGKANDVSEGAIQADLSTENNETTETESDFVSLSVVEPQLKGKVDSCFDESKIKTNYELTADEPCVNKEDKENNLPCDPAESYFQRNSSLTQSQRRKITPKLNFQEIVNLSYDSHHSDTSRRLFINQVTKEEIDINLSNQSTNSNEITDGHNLLPHDSFEASMREDQEGIKES